MRIGKILVAALAAGCAPLTTVSVVQTGTSTDGNAQLFTQEFGPTTKTGLGIREYVAAVSCPETDLHAVVVRTQRKKVQVEWTCAVLPPVVSNGN